MTGRWRVLRGIREKLVVSFSLLVAAIAVFVFAFFPARLERQALGAAIAKAEAIRDMTAYSLGAPLFFSDTAGVREVALGASRRADVRSLVVRDATGAPIAAYGATLSDSDWARTASGFITSDRAAYITGAVVTNGTAAIGTLTVGLSLAELRAEVATARRLGAMVGLLIVAIGLALVYAISTLVTRPLHDVSRTVDRIAAGDLSLRATDTPDAEVSRLVRAFNRMVDSLVGAQADLASANQGLEARVEERTAELRRAVGEQRLAQQALATSESAARATSEMLQSVIDLAPQAIIAVDTDWNITRWNRATERLFGWTAAEVIGRPIPFIPPESRAEFQLRRNDVEADRSIAATEVSRERKDGSRVDVLMSAGPLRDRDQRVTGFIAVITDVTERKLLEAQLRQSQKMEAIGRLAGGVAHDFNNILTVITACASSLLERTHTPNDREDLEQISTAAMRAAGLTRQLLTFSRKQVVQLEPVNFNNIVHGMGPMLRRLLRENIELTTRLGSDLGSVIADPSQIEQVIMNLVVNASDAMSDGGALTIATQNVILTDAYAREHPAATPGSHVQLVVTDTGIGMDAPTVARVFEPFFTTKGIGQGTGLGLATTYAIVTQVGGHVEVESTPGHGTTFRILVPHAMVEPRTVKVSPPPVPNGARPVSGPTRETLLLVEDEESVRRMLSRTLARLGYTVLECADGESALALVASHTGPIDAVVTDLMMPGINGRILAGRLQTDRPDLKVVFMSGYADDSVNMHGIVDRTHVFIQKPFTSAQLATKIRELIGEIPVSV